ncbi:hypothetical protein TSTA_098650 [Talaromyces stipitatus ATCC 10500]|uniref:Reverse transcriptase n=1 Tax=Talaromyces stipitatus (strain ATCC 10500 / CBS 375.48 / QM 6759 / NRRL 1006) TaxID=441959 RepID=B8MMP1_TALSN|nr:uncharacterized protein TSTA_098650 [Talaromyces stipitatus ATCC 10500]EED13608.1 hypothetical protein TSTA_098650 [Talaromyces stipitatus ATCC 10500]
MVPKPSGRLDVPLIIKGVEIKPTDSIKYLGVYLDTHLTGEVHVQEMRKKAAKLVAGLSSIAGSTWGTPLDQALHQISGAFKHTSRQALEVCLHVPPAELTLAKLAEEACLRIMTSPLRSTLYQIRGQAHCNDPYTSPLHRLETAIDHKLGSDTSQCIETIYPFVVPPWWEPPEARIDDTREEAIKAIEAISGTDTTIQFFTDGSGFDNGIGAAVYSSIGQAYKPWVQATKGSQATRKQTAGKVGCSRGDTAYTGERPHSQDQRTQSDYTTRRTNVVYSKSVNYPYGSVSPEATCRLCKEVEGTVGACQPWTASLSDNQSTNEDGVAAARGITTGLEFSVNPTTNR